MNANPRSGSPPPEKQRSGPATTPDRSKAADSTGTANVHGGDVVDLSSWRERRAWHDALDWLDAHGACCCWVLPRPHPQRTDSAS